MNFNEASRGVTINFDFPAGGGGSCFNCSNKIILKNFLARFARSCFINSSLILS